MPRTVTLLYLEDCPSWRQAAALVREVLAESGRPGTALRLELVRTREDAERLGFVGSPTLLVDGVDPFRTEPAEVALACRLYRTEEGLRGLPSRAQIERALAQP